MAAFFNLLGENEQQLRPAICFNTDSAFDILTGEIKQGIDGKYYINGGMSPAVIGVMGRSNMYKSTFAASLMARIASIYRQQVAIFDSEDSIGRGTDRLCRLAGNHMKDIVPEQFLKFDATVEYDLAATEKKLKEFGEKKMAHKKELTFTTPFLDPVTCEPRKVWAPTLVFIDSLTEMHSNEEDEMLDSKQGLADSKVKTVYMKDANNKTIFLRKIRRMAIEYGFVVVTTAHYGKQLNLDSYGPTAKQLQFMQQDYGPKGVGSKFLFLTSPQFMVNSCKCLQDDAKECWYKLNGQTPKLDVNEIVVQIQRCKNSPSGTVFPYVVSQENGLLTETTDFNYLKSMKNFGLNGNNVTCQCFLTPDVNLTRNTMRGVCQEKPEEIRALQLAMQLCLIGAHFSQDAIMNTFGWNAAITPDTLMDFLKSDKNKYTVDRILHSRGYWLPKELEDDSTPEYLSIMDILDMYHKTIK